MEHKPQKQPVRADLKIILIGDSAVGKSKYSFGLTSLLFKDWQIDSFWIISNIDQKFMMNNFISEERNLSTFAVTLFRHKAKVKGKEYEVDLWDTAGQDDFDSVHPSYYFQAQGAILVFDVTRKITYKNLKKWYNELRKHCPKIPCILIANKIDLKRSVTNQKFGFAEKKDMPLFFTSAADGTNVVKIFREILESALEYKTNPPDKYESDLIDLLNDSELFEHFKDVKKPQKKQQKQ